MARGRFVHGFSLVELMAAAAIMGILVSLALPALPAVHGTQPYGGS